MATHQPTYLATELPLSPELERRSRMRKYSIMMAIRLVCIGLCLVVKGWWLVLPAVGAIVLPYVAVIVANNVKPRSRGRVQRPGAVTPSRRMDRP